jgi:hypothetical protein
MMPTRWLIIASTVALVGCGRSGLPATPLFAGVEGSTYSEGTRLIQDRLNGRFPAGTSAAKLREYLEQQGLRVEPAARSPTPNGGVAFVKYNGSVCGSQVRVTWKGDAAGRIERIDALYSDTGCP